MAALPFIPVTVIGSWSFPGWYVKFCEDVSRQPELFGPDDREEALRDAVRLAVDDQLRAGADIITDGEMQRIDFNLGFYYYLEGLKRLPPSRLWGPTASGQPTRYVRAAPLRALQGLGLAREYRGRAVGFRSYQPLFPHLARAPVQQLALEFASREMAEIELLKHVKPPMEVAIGLVDVKNTWIEPPELVAQRLRQALNYIEPER